MGHDDMTTLGQCTIRWSPAADSAARDGLLAKMQAIRPTTKRRTAINYERNRARAREVAERILAEPDNAAMAAKRPVVVRIYYRSQGGDLLAFDTAPMTPCASDRLIDHCRQSDVIDWDIFPSGGARGLRKDARLVVLPSQVADSVHVVSGDPVTEPTTARIAAMCMPSDGYEPDDSRDRIAAESRCARASRSYFAEAMARRAQRWSRSAA